MVLRTPGKQNRVLLLSSIALILLSGSESNALDTSKFTFTLEMVTAEKGAVASRMWTVGTAIVITEPVSLPTPCDEIDGEVHVQGRKIFVTLKPQERGLPKSIECKRKTAPAGVKVMIRDLPAGDFSVTIETPQRTTTEMLLIDR